MSCNYDDRFDQLQNKLAHLYPGFEVKLHQLYHRDSMEIIVYKPVEISMGILDQDLSKNEIMEAIIYDIDQSILQTPIVEQFLKEKDKEIRELKDLLKNVKIIAEEKAHPVMKQGIVFNNDPLQEIREKVQQFELK